MRLKNLIINNFRIIDRIEIKPKTFNLIIGDNGQGKTSILEAISLIFGNSFKRTHDRNLVKFDKNYYLIQAEVGFSDSSINSNILEVFYQLNSKKVFKLNDKKVNRGYLVIRFPVVKFSLRDINFVYEARLRRLFFDKMISYIDKVYYNNLVRLIKALKNKNKLLQEGKDTSFWDIVIAETSSVIKKKRIKLVKSFNYFLSSYKEYFPESIERIEVVYNSSIEGVEKEEILQSLKLNRERDKRRGFSSSVNFDIYNIMINSKDLKDFASFGQSKIIVIILYFLQALFIYNNVKIEPIILLDDFFSDIDSNNRSKIVEIAKETGFQTFVTSTVEDFKSFGVGMDINVFKIRKGSIFEIESF